MKFMVNEASTLVKNTLGINTIEIFVAATLLSISSLFVMQGHSNVQNAEVGDKKRWQANQVMESVVDAISSSGEDFIKSALNYQISNPAVTHFDKYKVIPPIGVSPGASFTWLTSWEKENLLSNILVEIRAYGPPFSGAVPKGDRILVIPIPDSAFLRNYDVEIIVKATYHPSADRTESINWKKEMSHYLP
jgi:hypothetical protein